MQLRTTAPATLPELVRSLGVAEADVAQVAARVAADNHLPPSAPVPSGTVLQLADALFPDAFDAKPSAARPLLLPLQSAGSAASAKVVETATPGRPLGVLGLHGLQRGAPAARANDLGALSSLLGIGVPGLVDRGHLEVKVPLKAGRASLPLGDGRTVAVDIPPGTRLRLLVTTAAGPRGPEVVAGDLAFSRAVRVLNPAEMALGGAAGALADTAGALVGAQVLVDGLRMEKDGRIVPRGKVERPSLNPLKHVFSDGKSSLSLDAFTSAAPSLSPRLADLLGPGGPGGAPRFDVRGLLDAMGGVAESGSFTLQLEGRAGFVDVGDGQIAVRGRDQALVATLSGTFAVDAGGALHAGYHGKLSSPEALPVRLRLDEAAAGAAVGPVAVAATPEGVELRLGDELLGVVRHLRDRYGVELGPAVEAELHGGLTFGGTTHLSVDGDGVHLQHDGVHARVELGGTKLKSDAFELRLAESSGVTLDATAARLEDGRLVLDNAHGGFSLEVEAGGHAARGALSAALSEPARLQGTFGLGGDVGGGPGSGAGGVEGSGEARLTVRARPRLAGVPMPVTVGVEQALRVRLTRDSIVFSSTNDAVRLGV